MADTRENILLLYTDQQRFDTIAAWGADHVATPNIDRLARMGTSFTRAYTSCPLCQPARHDLITGVGPRHHGYYFNTDLPIRDYGLPTLPRLLAEAGYATLAVGKMHFVPEREHHGFEYMHLMEEFPTSREADQYLQYLESVGYGHIRCQHGVRPLCYHTPQVSIEPEEHHGSAWVATKAIELLSVPRDRPWFMFAGWIGPHPPYYLPEKYLDMYKDKPCPPPCLAPEGELQQIPPSPDDPDGQPLRLQRLREAYFASVTLIDGHIGRILDALAAGGQLDNTIIIFTSDHGEMLGDRGMFMKGVPYEGAAHIPLIIAGPGFAAGEVRQSLCTTWDISVTILDAAGLSPPEGHPMIGVSLLGDEADDPQRIVVYHYGQGPQRYLAAVGGRFKFIHWFNGGQEELYGLADDPWEQRNLLSENPAGCKEIADELRAACAGFEATHGIAENVKDGQLVDVPYKPYHGRGDMAAGLYPYWAQESFPRWMIGYSQDDLRAIAAEIRRCLQAETSHIYKDAAWRSDAVAKWKAIGGDESVYREFFEASDSKSSKQ